MAVVGLENVHIEPWPETPDAGLTGGVRYERVDAIVHYAVDPDVRGNDQIADLGLAPRGDDGLVHFRGDFTLLRPVDVADSNGVCLLEVPNRGRRVATVLFNQHGGGLPQTREIPIGDGWLFRKGYTVAWVGWQWDVPRNPGRMGLEPPSVADELEDGVEVQLRFQLDADSGRVPLTDQHVGDLGFHVPIPTADVTDPKARLLVRDGLHQQPTEIDRGRWAFPDTTSVALEGDFVAGRIYDLIYRTDVVPVVGAGLLAVRDLAAFLKSDHADNPVAERNLTVVAAGISQNSRSLRHQLWLGLERNESGDRVIDGVLALVGGARRGQFNNRGGQPSVQPTLDFGHLFPFADLPQTDPHTGDTAGLLDRVGAYDDPPKIIMCDSASEYWRGDAALAHTSVDPPVRDVDDAEFVRRYLFAGAEHAPAGAISTRHSKYGSRGANLLNTVDYRPLYRAVLSNLVAWIQHGTEPPASEVPRIDDGTAVRRRDALEQLDALGALELPDANELAFMSAIDLGDRRGMGIGCYPARVVGPPLPDWVSAVDDDGNEKAGIAMPDVTVPVATHLGFNPRHPATGAPAQIIEYTGSSVPFALTEAERSRTRDQRPSIEARYADRDDYLTQVRAAAEDLVARRHLLAEDIELCVDIAAERWDMIHHDAS